MNTERTSSDTDAFVAEVDYQVGTTAYGYGDNAEAALRDARGRFVGVVDDVRVWAKTDRTADVGRCRLNVYKLIR